MRFTRKVVLAGILFCSLSSTGLAQDTRIEISGKVMNAVDRTPLPFATVFLSNTTIGTTADAAGAFELKDVPAGKYDMVISFLGFATQVVAVDPGGKHTGLEILLQPKTGQLQEVVITFDKRWKENYELFKKDFIGRSSDAASCDILNPEVLSLKFDDKERVLTASTEEPLVIRNKALGYTIHYLLESFQHDYGHQYTSYYGYPRFEAMKAKSRRQQKKWEKRRLRAYRGSMMHFMRALVTRRLEAEGFLVKKLVRNNAEVVPGKPLLNGDYHFKPSKGQPDTVFIRQSGWSRNKGISVLYTGELPYDSITGRQKVNGYTRLSFHNSLYIVYTKEKEEAAYVSMQHPFDRNQPSPSFQTTILTMMAPEADIDENGNLADPLAVITEGYWGYEQIAELLPLDYRPPQK